MAVDLLIGETTAIITAIDQVKLVVDQIKIAGIVDTVTMDTVTMDIVTMDMVVVVDVMMNVDSIKSTYEPDGPIRTN